MTAALVAAYLGWAQRQQAGAAAGAARPWTPELGILWQDYAGPRPVLIVLGTPLFTKFSGGFFRDPRLNEWEEAKRSIRVREVQKTLGSSYASPWYNFTGVGEATGAFLVGSLLGGRNTSVSLMRSIAVPWDDIARHNVVFLGSPKFIPQLKDMPFKQDFVIEGGALRNLRPRPGEPEVFPEVWAPSYAALLEDHAVITRVPGLHGHGGITILAASSTEGSWAAAEYVTRGQYAKELVARVGGGSRRLPEAYQVVVRAKFLRQVPVEILYVTHRVLEDHGNGPSR